MSAEGLKKGSVEELRNISRATTSSKLCSSISGRLALDRTAKWLSKAVAEVSTSATNGALGADATVVAKDISPNTSPTAVLNQAYMDLLHWEPGKEAYPEVEDIFRHSRRYRYCKQIGVGPPFLALSWG